MRAARISTADVAAATQARAPVAETAAAPGRLLFVDNVRWAMILLVLSMHAADTYSPLGNWYYTERPAAGPLTTLFFATWQGFLQAFFMALLFFVAGYFTPRSYDARGARSFLSGRLFRLGLPTLLYVAAIGPVTEFYVAHSWHTKQSFAHEMWLYLVRGRFLSGTGPMWFCAALLIFCFGYAAWRLASRAAAVRQTRAVQPTWTGVASAIAALAVSTFLARVAAPVGTSYFNMQLCDFASYIIMFGLGVAAWRGGWLERITDRFAWTTAGFCVGAAAVTWLPLLALGGAASGRFADYAGGLHWQSAAMSFWEALVCVGMAFGVLAVFRRWLNGQGRASKFMSDHAFAVYVIHPPILIGLALLISGVTLAPVAKFLMLWGLSAGACFGLAAPLALRIPGLGRILR
ncbi:MAG: acyltransferase family protein [Caulobacterales bacterium]